MKRFIVLIVSTAVLLSLAACTKQNPDPSLQTSGAVQARGTCASDIAGVHLQIADAKGEQGLVSLDVTWHNETEYDAWVGGSYTIEHLKTGEWVDCRKPDSLDSEGFNLKAGATRKKSYDLAASFDIAESGRYRFRAYCFVYNNACSKCELTAEFTVSISGSEPSADGTPVTFSAQYIRTGSPDGEDFPAVKIIRSVEELNAYCASGRDGEAQVVNPELTDACAKYDSAYFEKQILLMVLLQETSGSIRHEVDSVKATPDGELLINIHPIVPEAGTCDMAEWHILIEPAAGVTIDSEEAVTVLLDGVNPKKQPRLVSASIGHTNMSLRIPYNWEYMIESGQNSGEFCIAFWPAEQTEGRIALRYYNSFAVCGTGLEQEFVLLGGYGAYQGFFDGGKVWNFIAFSGLPGFYVATNEDTNVWWKEYGDEAMQILDTVRLADGMLNEAQAIEAAKKQVTIKYNRTVASYDASLGQWTVTFSKDDSEDGTQVVTIFADPQYNK